VCKKSEQVTKAHPGMTVKTSNSATIYYIDSQNIKHEVTASGMNQNFIISKFVMTVPENLLQGFTSGDLINGGVWYLTDRTGSGIGCGGGVTPPPNTDDKTAPTVSITQPTTGGTVSGNMTFSADAQDNNGGSGVDYVKFFVDNQEVGRDSNAPYSISWDTKGKSNQAIIALSVQAVDKAGNASGMVGGVNVKVDNSVSTGTTIEFTAPRNGDTIKDWVDLTVKLNNIQGGGIQDPGVRFYVKKPGTQTYSYINSANASPYTIQWDSKTVANGQVSFKAEVTDKTNTNSETTINVTVANSDPTVAFVGVAPQEGTITALKVGFEKTDRHVGKFQIANPNPYPITVTSIAFTDTGKKAADNYVYDLWSMYNADSNNPDNWQSSKSLNPNLSFDNLANGGVVIPQNQSASINFIVRINNLKSIGAAQAGDLFTLSVVPDQLKFKVKESDAGHDLNGNGNKTDELTFSFKGTAKLGTVIVPNP
jgi:hypothetical protein